uniref:Protein kinase domain-containing protein n=2 Tax=Caenorhabditis tropicalis TaxID=1561998 RepID=A0A1I7UCE1_9PELO
METEKRTKSGKRILKPGYDVVEGFGIDLDDFGEACEKKEKKKKKRETDGVAPLVDQFDKNEEDSGAQSTKPEMDKIEEPKGSKEKADEQAKKTVEENEKKEKMSDEPAVKTTEEKEKEKTKEEKVEEPQKSKEKNREEEKKDKSQKTKSKDEDEKPTPVQEKSKLKTKEGHRMEKKGKSEVSKVVKPTSMENDSKMAKDRKLAEQIQKGETSCSLQQIQYIADENTISKFSSMKFLLIAAVFLIDLTSADSDDDPEKKEVKDGSTFTKRALVFFFIYGFLVLLAFIGFLVWRLRRSKNESRRNDSALQNIYNGMRDTGEEMPDSLKNCPLDEKIDYLPYKKQYEIAKENLEKKNVLGKGNFGIVKKGMLRMAKPKTEEEEKIRLPVAIKSAANPYDIVQTSMLAEELRLMCAIGKFPNVLALIGAVTVDLRKGCLLVVTEFVDCGDLHTFLRDNKDIFENHLVEDKTEKCEPDSYLTPLSTKRKTYLYTQEGGDQETVIKESLKSLATSDLLSFGLQIANGMQYLASIPLVHRDLALRNVLLKKNKTIRIADFGMAKKHESKDYYKPKNSKNNPVPIRWMSPEAYYCMRFTQQSDVWSFGICLYELFTLGGLPYPDVKSEDVYTYMHNGGRCFQPEHCHVELYNLMKLCWNQKPELRPTFSVIVEYFIEHMNTSAPQLLEYVERMLREEAKSQSQLDEWIRMDR